ncbi:MAG: precorrin-6y C5,15-methyltransferase (decarboxylating) subunit CbiE [Hyphomicrobiaceae bacterium]
MTLAENPIVHETDAEARWLNVIGIGDDGWDGLGTEARNLVEAADLIAGGARHIGMVPSVRAETRVWSGDFSSAVRDLEQERGRLVVVLASGDPLLYGVGALVARTFDRGEVRVLPHISTFAHICARMVWPQLDAEQVSLCGRPVERLRRALHDGHNLVVLSADGTTPATVARYLCAHGFGRSTMHVFEHLGGKDEAHREMAAADLDDSLHFADLNALAIECRADDGARAMSVAAGLPDDVFEHDGQITKREVRSITLARLEPQPGQLLWDIGLGSGSVSIEWLRFARGMRAIGVERNAGRAARARRNADSLGVARLTIVEGAATDVISDLKRPDAIFIGGGLTSEGLVPACWNALLPGGRLVANTVTLESEAILLEAFRTLGGDLTRIAIERADPVGTLTGWRPGMTVIQWAVTKPRDGDAG